ncbi:ImmA/IrrE family metallo-endopeptidase [Acinetobacter sp. V102_4]|uniref:ImmA/IrrE family metallo-endopeptidase n=1 Tax=Acinetobacter sp. V102_4 TaxID=3072984 RepID=UPI00287E1664|nr:ImmA/IrrE family metallo-endopeptidase [Acinetobacter sp. V102_4]MDS7931876.1 ImmA/IrrE family metallo-endopeptidase [Acinetobacter sp. V102_4]
MEQIGNLSANELATKSDLKLSVIKGLLSSVEPLITLSELERIAQVLFIPSVYLTTHEISFSPEIPDIVDHRNLENVGNSTYGYNSVIREAIQARQDYIYLLESMGNDPIPFTLRLSGQDAISDSNLISSYFDLKNKSKKAQHNDYYSSWRSILESMDILVIERSSHESFGSDGFCLWFDVVPVIVVLSTGQSSERRLFTILHELVHLGLRQSVFDGFVSTLSNDNYLERYCDSVAGHVIAPFELLEKLYDPNLSIDDLVLKVRSKVKASRPAVAIQLKLAGYITQEELKLYLRNLEDIKISKRQGGEVKIPASIRIVSKFGKYFVQTVISAMYQNNISSTKAKSILGIKDSHKASTFKDVQKRVHM